MSGERRNWSSWGGYPPVDGVYREVWWQDEVAELSGSYLPVGAGRSYGDSGLLRCADGEMVGAGRLDRIRSFDEERGHLTVEAGCTVGGIINWALPKGWFPPVVPGTQHVTLAGAVANDIHGKNHHAAGTLGRWIERIKLFRSDRGWVECGPDLEPALFKATVGGLGLTGMMTEITVRLERIEGKGFVQEESRRFGSLREASDVFEEFDRSYPMTVSWLELGDSKAGRGVVMGGKFAVGESPAGPLRRPRLGVPVVCPGGLINGGVIKGFNFLYASTRRDGVKTVPYGNYFFPLDGLSDWNRLYGKRGFLQYQFVIPTEAFDTLEMLSGEIGRVGQPPSLSVLKKFGALESPGYLSFPREGWTLAMDFPMKGKATLDLLDRLDEIVADAGGRLYPAKDARMSGAMFRRGFPEWIRLEEARDAAINSEFWKRVSK